MNIFNLFARLPTVSEHINDFVELAAPVPEKKCRLVKYLVPTVVCKVSVELWLLQFSRRNVVCKVSVELWLLLFPRRNVGL